jgi:hypothetical protein
MDFDGKNAGISQPGFPGEALIPSRKFRRPALFSNMISRNSTGWKYREASLCCLMAAFCVVMIAVETPPAEEHYNQFRYIGIIPSSWSVPVHKKTMSDQLFHMVDEFNDWIGYEEWLDRVGSTRDYVTVNFIFTAPFLLLAWIFYRLGCTNRKENGKPWHHLPDE